MKSILIREINQNTLNALKRLAKFHNRSLQGELHAIIDRAIKMFPDFPPEQRPELVTVKTKTTTSWKDGKGIMHALLRVGESPFMAADVWPGWEKGPEQSTSVGMWVYVEDCDSLWERAMKADGATVLMPMADMFWGDRMGKLKDPFGHAWSIATQIELSEVEKEALAANIRA